MSGWSWSCRCCSIASSMLILHDRAATPAMVIWNLSASELVGSSDCASSRYVSSNENEIEVVEPHEAECESGSENRGSDSRLAGRHCADVYYCWHSAVAAAFLVVDEGKSRTRDSRPRTAADDGKMRSPAELGRWAEQARWSRHSVSPVQLTSAFPWKRVHRSSANTAAAPDSTVARCVERERIDPLRLAAGVHGVAAALLETRRRTSLHLAAHPTHRLRMRLPLLSAFLLDRGPERMVSAGGIDR